MHDHHRSRSWHVWGIVHDHWKVKCSYILLMNAWSSSIPFMTWVRNGSWSLASGDCTYILLVMNAWWSSIPCVMCEWLLMMNGERVNERLVKGQCGEKIISIRQCFHILGSTRIQEMSARPHPDPNQCQVPWRGMSPGLGRNHDGEPERAEFRHTHLVQRNEFHPTSCPWGWGNDHHVSVVGEWMACVVLTYYRARHGGEHAMIGTSGWQRLYSHTIGRGTELIIWR